VISRNEQVKGSIPFSGSKTSGSKAELAYSVVRLESGDPMTISGTVDRDELIGQIKSLRDAAQKGQQRAATSAVGATVAAGAPQSETSGFLCSRER
jgi:hypothetical protein